jgi:hydroxymethylbilane synthase
VAFPPIFKSPAQMITKKLIIGSRGSDLALWQANFVKSELEKCNLEVEIKIIKTQGDKIQNIGFDKMEGKGFFTKELEAALLNQEIDLAVHSCKDLETTMPAGLTIAAYTEREDPRDFLLAPKGSIKTDDSGWPILDSELVVGTSSIRRKTLLKHYFPKVEVKDLRGNVPTRVAKLAEGNYDAILLAGAGLNRLNLALENFEVIKLDPNRFIPAPAQGVLAIQIREEDLLLHQVLSDHLAHSESSAIAGIERGILRKVQGGCQVPLGAYCLFNQGNDSYTVKAFNALKIDITKVKFAEVKGTDPNEIIEETFAAISQ